MEFVKRRAAFSFLLSFAVFAASALGLRSGMTLSLSHDGHLDLEFPRHAHAIAHAQGADHHDHDFGGGSDHDDLHHLLAASESHLSNATAERAQLGPDHVPGHPASFSLHMPASALADISVPRPAVTHTPFDLSGGTARTQIASLRTIVLIV